MTIKSDNPAEIGVHTFEVAGHGAAPFRCVGFSYVVGPLPMKDKNGRTIPGSFIGSPGQPMGTCDHCGNGIANCFHIKSADGKKFVVGSSCVEKTDDRGLIQSYKNNREFRKQKREMRHAREAKKIEALPAMIEELLPTLAAMPHPYERRAAVGDTLYDFATFTMERAGNAGKCKLYSKLSKLTPLSDDELTKQSNRIAAAKSKHEKEKADAAEFAKAEADRRAGIETEIEKHNAPLIRILENTPGEFAADIGSGLKKRKVNGYSYRVVEILRDIYAKSHGRRNSKAYDAATIKFDKTWNAE